MVDLSIVMLVLPEGRCLYHPPLTSDGFAHKAAMKQSIRCLENTKQSAKGHRVSSTIKDISDGVS